MVYVAALCGRTRRSWYPTPRTTHANSGTSPRIRIAVRSRLPITIQKKSSAQIGPCASAWGLPITSRQTAPHLLCSDASSAARGALRVTPAVTTCIPSPPHSCRHRSNQFFDPTPSPPPFTLKTIQQRIIYTGIKKKIAQTFIKWTIKI